MLPVLLALLMAGPSISTQSPLPTGIQGIVYSQAFSASGGAVPYKWSLSAGDLPPGMGLNADGSIAGKPTAPGTYSFTVRVTDSQGEFAAATFSATVDSASAAPIIKNPSPLVSGNIGTLYSMTFEADGGNAPYAWTAAQSTLPPGLALDSSGKLNGNPTATGVFSFTVSVTDRVGVNIAKEYSLTILATPK